MSDLAWDQRLARVLMRPLAAWGVSPNLVTSFGLLLGLIAAGLIASGETVLMNIGAGVYMLAIFMDHADGELARMTGKTSRFGHYYDHFCALSNYLLIFIALGIGLDGKFEPGAFLSELWGGAVGMGLIAAISISLIFALRAWVEEFLGKTNIRQTVRGGFEIEDILYLLGPVIWFGGGPLLLSAAAIGAPLFGIWVSIETWRVVRKAGRP